MTKQGLGATGGILSGLSIYIGGKNTFGKTESVKLPDWEFEVVNEESTGLIKSPNISLEVSDLSPAYISAIQNGETFIIKGNVREDGRDFPYVATMSVQLHKVGTELKEGDSVKRTLEGRINTFEETYKGSQTVNYNRDGLVLILGGNGKNLLAEFAQNV